MYSGKPKSIPEQKYLSNDEIDKLLKRINENIVYVYELSLKEKDRKKILDRLFDKKNRLSALKNFYNQE